MNKTQFTQFLQTPAQLTPDSAAQLAEVLKAFPYCQTAQLLYVKSLHNQKSMLYNSQLKIAAAYATDRTVLHDLINGPGTHILSGQQQPERNRSRSDEQIVTELSLPPEPPPVKQPAVKTETPVKPPRPSVDQRSAQEILDARLKELGLKAKNEEELKQEAEAKEKRRQEAELIRQQQDAEARRQATEESAKKTEEEKEKLRIIQERISAPEPEPKTEPVDTDSTLKAIEDLDTLSDAYISTAIDAKIRLEVEKEDPAIPQEHWNAAQEEEDAELSFSDWLKKTKALKKQQNEDLLHSKEATEVKKSAETDLIERFIKEEPRITKPKKEFYSPVNMARQSVVEDPEFVTETLANIYASQGNTAKAIMAYHTLSLKYPEKKLYFASLISKLESGEEKK
jgi:hypothetical protein